MYTSTTSVGSKPDFFRSFWILLTIYIAQGNNSSALWKKIDKIQKKGREHIPSINITTFLTKMYLASHLFTSRATPASYNESSGCRFRITKTSPESLTKANVTCYIINSRPSTRNQIKDFNFKKVTIDKGKIPYHLH